MIPPNTAAQVAEAPSHAASVVQTAGIWTAVAAGFSSIPWANLAAAAAFFWSLHLIVGWWMDRLKSRQKRRKA